MGLLEEKSKIGVAVLGLEPRPLHLKRTSSSTVEAICEICPTSLNGQCVRICHREEK